MHLSASLDKSYIALFVILLIVEEHYGLHMATERRHYEMTDNRKYLQNINVEKRHGKASNNLIIKNQSTQKKYWDKSKRVGFPIFFLGCSYFSLFSYFRSRRQRFEIFIFWRYFYNINNTNPTIYGEQCSPLRTGRVSAF